MRTAATLSRGSESWMDSRNTGKSHGTQCFIKFMELGQRRVFDPLSPEYIIISPC